jgi:hypothetical protein
MTQMTPTVHIRDRRRGRRLLTLRNSTWAAAIALVLFAGISISSELGDRKSGEYGRLYAKRAAEAANARPQPTVITEAPQTPATEIRDDQFADPLRIEAQQKEAILGADNIGLDPRAQLQPSDEYVQNFEPEQKLSLNNDGQHKKARFVITGGAGGVYTATQ